MCVSYLFNLCLICGSLLLLILIGVLGVSCLKCFVCFVFGVSY